MGVLLAALLATAASYDAPAAGAERVTGRLAERFSTAAENINPADFGRYADAEPRRRSMGTPGTQGRPKAAERRQALPEGRRRGRQGTSGRKVFGEGARASGGLQPVDSERVSAESSLAPFRLPESRVTGGAGLSTSGGPRAAQSLGPNAGAPHWADDVWRAASRQGSDHSGPFTEVSRSGTSSSSSTSPQNAAAKRAHRLREVPLTVVPQAARAKNENRSNSPVFRTASMGAGLFQQGGIALVLFGLGGPLTRRLRRREAKRSVVHA